MKYFITALMVGSLCASMAFAGIEGNYTIAGKNPNGTRYQGMLVIAKLASTYELRWKVGQSAYRGTGILVGNTLSVGWLAQTDSCGVVSYKVSKTRLDGIWANCGAIQTGTETASKR